jgi:hypothetical protein
VWSAGWRYYSPEREQVFPYQQQDSKSLADLDLSRFAKSMD